MDWIESLLAFREGPYEEVQTLAICARDALHVSIVSFGALAAGTLALLQQYPHPGSASKPNHR